MKRSLLLSSVGIAVSVMILSVAIAQASHEPLKPFIPLGFPFETSNPLLFKISIQGKVPTEYRNAASEAFTVWEETLTENGGEWKFVRTSFGEDISIPVIYDEVGNSRFCKNFLAGKTPPHNVGTRIAVFVGCKDSFLDVNDVKVGVMHRIGHALGMGDAKGGANSIMCDTYSQSDGLCSRSAAPTELDLFCVVKMYGADGFGRPNPHSIPRFCLTG